MVVLFLEKSTLICVLLLLSLFLINSVTCFSGTIGTIPPSPSNTIASGYGDIVVEAEFEDRDLLFCTWLYNGIKSKAFYDEVFFCESTLLRASFGTITCTNKMGYIKTNLTFSLPSYAILDISVECKSSSGNSSLRLPTKTVRECSRKLPSYVTVEADSYFYGATGTFKCPNGELFYLNRTLSTTPIQASCLYSATWSVQNILECWTAQNVTIGGSVVGNSGTNLNLSCKHKVVNPPGNYSTFYFRNSSKKILTTEVLTISLRPEYDRTTVYCQPITPYTLLYPDMGKSLSYTINVLYKPFQNEAPVTCYWFTNQSGLCNITFKANPTPDFVNLTKYGDVVKNDVGNIIKDGAEYPIKQFSFYRAVVSSNDRGTYKLTLNSSVFPEHQTIAFTVVVDGVTDDPMVWLVITVLVLSLVLTAIISAAVFLYGKRRRKAISRMNGRTDMSSMDYVNSGRSRAMDEYVAAGIIDPYDAGYANRDDEAIDGEENPGHGDEYSFNRDFSVDEEDNSDFFEADEVVEQVAAPTYRYNEQKQERNDFAEKLASLDPIYGATIPRVQQPRSDVHETDRHDAFSYSHGNRVAANFVDPDAARRFASMNRSHHSTVPRTQSPRPVTRSPGKYNRRDVRSGSLGNRTANQQNPEFHASMNPAHHSTVPRSQPFRHVARSAAEDDYDHDYDYRRRYIRY